MSTGPRLWTLVSTLGDFACGVAAGRVGVVERPFLHTSCAKVSPRGGDVLERFRAGSLAALVKRLSEERVGVMVEPQRDGWWSIGLIKGSRGVSDFAEGATLPDAVSEALRRCRRGEHVEALGG